MARYTLNDDAFEHAKRLIERRQYVLRSDWGEVQPSAADENGYLERHGWDDYAARTPLFFPRPPRRSVG